MNQSRKDCNPGFPSLALKTVYTDLRSSFEKMLDGCGRDVDAFCGLTETVVDEYEWAENRGNQNLSSTMLLFLNRIQERAYKEMNPKDYHIFCERTKKLHPVILSHM